jgi:hypothetical protein
MVALSGNNAGRTIAQSAIEPDCKAHGHKNVCHYTMILLCTKRERCFRGQDFAAAICRAQRCMRVHELAAGKHASQGVHVRCAAALEM